MKQSMLKSNIKKLNPNVLKGPGTEDLRARF